MDEIRGVAHVGGGRKHQRGVLIRPHNAIFIRVNPGRREEKVREKSSCKRVFCSRRKGGKLMSHSLSRRGTVAGRKIGPVERRY